ncbi:MAG: hypothetical protein J7L95_04570 [Prolixibacteraceae bacterium]|nr:hypothetical protein [Prolixibacteraceae bacterium]
METDNLFHRLSGWIESTGLFVRPAKKISGEWELYEYYIEPGKELQNIKEEKLTQQHLFLKINFGEGQIFSHHSNLTVPVIQKTENGHWSISKNYVTLIHPFDFRKNVKFQFAIQKDYLRLLKKDELGRIEFFGFFRRVKEN